MGYRSDSIAVSRDMGSPRSRYIWAVCCARVESFRKHMRGIRPFHYFLSFFIMCFVKCKCMEPLCETGLRSDNWPLATDVALQGKFPQDFCWECSFLLFWTPCFFCYFSRCCRCSYCNTKTKQPKWKESRMKSKQARKWSRNNPKSN